MRPPLVACFVVLLAAAAVAPPAGAMCVPRKPGAPGTVPTPAKLAPKPTPTPPKATPVAPGGDIIKAMCAKADDPKFCQTSIANQPPLPGGKKLDGAGVLQLAMNVVRAKAAEAKKAAAALAADPKNAPYLGPLKDCVDSYDDVPDSLGKAEAAIAAGDKDGTSTFLDTCHTDVDTCEQGFEDMEIKPLMAKQDAELGKLTSNCLAIAEAAGLIPPSS